MFIDRTDAGQRLALALSQYKDSKVLVLGIPRGGVEVAYHVATYLNADFSIVVSRKLPYPDNPEAGFGAIAEDGSFFIFRYAAHTIEAEVIDQIVRQQQVELKRRVQVLRQGKAPAKIKGRTVILVDDGIAMGSTMRAAIMLCRNKMASKVVVASPVAGAATAEEIASVADETVILEKPAFFQAVAQVYLNWRDVRDEEVIQIMKRWQQQKKNRAHQKTS